LGQGRLVQLRLESGAQRQLLLVTGRHGIGQILADALHLTDIILQAQAGNCIYVHCYLDN
jgi:hypothetical protein